MIGRKIMIHYQVQSSGSLAIFFGGFEVKKADAQWSYLSRATGCVTEPLSQTLHADRHIRKPRPVMLQPQSYDFI